MSDEVKLCDDCGKEEDSFACRIRHIQINTGACNSKREFDEERRKTAQVKKYGI